MSDKVTMKEKISFALANLGNIPIQTILGSYLLIFYTNVIGLNPAACATLFLIARVMDALKDPFMGFLIDRLPTTKHGHFRPTLIVGTVLCSLNFLLIWFAPLMATSGKLAIAYVTYLMIGVLFPVMDISLNSMLPVMTLDMEERSALSAQKGFVYTLGSFLVNLSAPVIIGNVSEKEGYITLVLIAAAVIAGCSIAGALGLKERVQAQPGKDSYQIKDLFRILGQKPVAITFSAALIYMIGKYVMNTTLAYFFTYVIGNLKLMSVVSVVQLCALLPATLLVGALIRKIGRKKAYMLSLTLIGTAPLLRLIDVTSIPILLAAMAIGVRGRAVHAPDLRHPGGQHGLCGAGAGVSCGRGHRGPVRLHHQVRHGRGRRHSGLYPGSGRLPGRGPDPAAPGAHGPDCLYHRRARGHVRGGGIALRRISTDQGEAGGAGGTGERG